VVKIFAFPISVDLRAICDERFASYQIFFFAVIESMSSALISSRFSLSPDFGYPVDPHSSAVKPCLPPSVFIRGKVLLFPISVDLHNLRRKALPCLWKFQIGKCVGKKWSLYQILFSGSLLV
jgi:hypothetical protein